MQAFWKSLVEDLKLAPPTYARVLRVLEEIRDGLKGLGASTISEVIDIDFISLQVDKRVYGWECCTALITSAVETNKRIQASKRAEETNAKWLVIEASMRDASESEQPSAFCKALEFLLDRVSAMRIDNSNLQIRKIALVVKDHGIDYERGKFHEKLEAGLTIDRTTAWIQGTVHRVVATGGVELSNLLQGRAAAFVYVHSEAMLSLVTDRRLTVVKETCPETLFLDVHHLFDLQLEFQYLAKAITFMVTSTHAILASKDPADLPVMSSISALFVTQQKVIDTEATVKNIETLLLQTSLSKTAQTTLTRALVQCSSPSDAVHCLL